MSRQMPFPNRADWQKARLAADVFSPLGCMGDVANPVGSREAKSLALTYASSSFVRARAPPPILPNARNWFFVAKSRLSTSPRMA
jgi:hypothetical protein